jgi:GNAT superfamily N-acetyltransferase
MTEGLTPIIIARSCNVDEILPWRDMYRQEMNCQIIHDSLHEREGWTQEYFLLIDEAIAGYGSIVVGGPWKGKPTLFEWYVLPRYRQHMFVLFTSLLKASHPVAIETQSNDPLLTVMLHAFAANVQTESILFHDGITTANTAEGVVFRRATPDDAAAIAAQELDSGAQYVLEIDGTIAGTGGILFHYNRPYGDIYMAVAEPFRRRGLGAYLVQELKRTCYEMGSVPAARCNAKNIASRMTLQKAGFVPCGHILTGDLRERQA